MSKINVGSKIVFQWLSMGQNVAVLHTLDIFQANLRTWDNNSKIEKHSVAFTLILNTEKKQNKTKKQSC